MTTTPAPEQLTPEEKTPEEKKEDLVANEPHVHAKEVGYVGYGGETETLASTDVVFSQLVDEEKDHQVKHRTMR